MNKLKRIAKIGAGVATGLTVGVGQAMATTSIVDVSGVTVDTAMLGTVGALIAAGLGGLWGWRKFVKSINRS